MNPTQSTSKKVDSIKTNNTQQSPSTCNKGKNSFSDRRPDPINLIKSNRVPGQISTVQSKNSTKTIDKYQSSILDLDLKIKKAVKELEAIELKGQELQINRSYEEVQRLNPQDANLHLYNKRKVTQEINKKRTEIFEKIKVQIDLLTKQRVDDLFNPISKQLHTVDSLGNAHNKGRIYRRILDNFKMFASGKSSRFVTALQSLSEESPQSPISKKDKDLQERLNVFITLNKRLFKEMLQSELVLEFKKDFRPFVSEQQRTVLIEACSEKVVSRLREKVLDTLKVGAGYEPHKLNRDVHSELNESSKQSLMANKKILLENLGYYTMMLNGAKSLGDIYDILPTDALLQYADGVKPTDFLRIILAPDGASTKEQSDKIVNGILNTILPKIKSVNPYLFNNINPTVESLDSNENYETGVLLIFVEILEYIKNYENWEADINAKTSISARAVDGKVYNVIDLIATSSKSQLIDELLVDINNTQKVEQETNIKNDLKQGESVIVKWVHSFAITLFDKLMAHDIQVGADNTKVSINKEIKESFDGLLVKVNDLLWQMDSGKIQYEGRLLKRLAAIFFKKFSLEATRTQVGEHVIREIEDFLLGFIKNYDHIQDAYKASVDILGCAEDQKKESILAKFLKSVSSDAEAGGFSKEAKKVMAQLRDKSGIDDIFETLLMNVGKELVGKQKNGNLSEHQIIRKLFNKLSDKDIESIPNMEEGLKSLTPEMVMTTGTKLLTTALREMGMTERGSNEFILGLRAEQLLKDIEDLPSESFFDASDLIARYLIENEQAEVVEDLDVAANFIALQVQLAAKDKKYEVLLGLLLQLKNLDNLIAIKKPDGKPLAELEKKVIAKMSKIRELEWDAQGSLKKVNDKKTEGKPLSELEEKMKAMRNKTKDLNLDAWGNLDKL